MERRTNKSSGACAILRLRKAMGKAAKGKPAKSCQDATMHTLGAGTKKSRDQMRWVFSCSVTIGCGFCRLLLITYEYDHLVRKIDTKTVRAWDAKDTAAAFFWRQWASSQFIAEATVQSRWHVHRGCFSFQYAEVCMYLVELRQQGTKHIRLVSR